MSREYGDHIEFRGGSFTGPVSGRAVMSQSFQQAAVPAVMSALPPKTFGFSGRSAELELLLHALPSDGATAAPSSVVVCGLPGAGKTSLVVEAAHTARAHGWFPGGTLFLDLRGYDTAPVTPDLALTSLLRALGIGAEFIPPSADERSHLYRATLTQHVQAHGPVLVILDNASSPGQIGPLLPSDDTSRVLITSRDLLATLGARLMRLDVLSPEASYELLDHALRIADPDDDRIARDPDAAAALAQLCGHLPLALQIAAALLIYDPDRPTAELVHELSLSRDRTNALDDGERSVRHAFELSYLKLPAPHARLLRLLAVAPGAEFSTAAAEALFGESAEAVLHGLTRASLLQRGSERGRWRMHDLVRQYVLGTLADRNEEEAAVEQLLAHYARRTDAADRRLLGNGPESDPQPFDSTARALTWLDAEHENLVAAVLWAGYGGHESPYAVTLALALSTYLYRRGHSEDLAAVSRTAARVARIRHDSLAEAHAWNNHGIALRQMERLEEAAEAHARAHDGFAALGDHQGEALVRTRLAAVLAGQGRMQEAFETAARGRELFENLGDLSGQADAWTTLGHVTHDVGRAQDALDAFSKALELSRLIGDPYREGVALYSLGTALEAARRLEEAAHAFDEAASISHGCADWRGEAAALHALALLFEGQGRTDLARDHWQRAETAYTNAGDSAQAAIARRRGQSL